ncbi:MAG: hypothetical protein BGO03_11870 [Mesorhizobium sp. 61-13]|jgi:2-deoxy-D-gluconate 3-dehydrogenase|nr:SDR family oxidoreductase [Mesorhizobium sp.]OJU52350.1 MAG: hypothetical protein BGO03_11870 [Mesorhizobium sp. 61-13]
MSENHKSRKTVLVAGGSRGIGRSIAVALAKSGADVSIIGRDENALAQSARQIEAHSVKANVITADLSLPEGVELAYRRHMDAFGRVDVLVNNAAAGSSNNDILDVDVADFERMLRINVTSYFRMSQLVCGDMKKRGWGRVINITSSTALKARPKMGDYSISKAGELMLTRQFAVEMAEFGITVNAIAPTLTRTEFSRWQWEDDAELDKVVRNLPIKRLAEPEDTAGLAAFLASEAASMITGAIIPVDGGSLA